MKLEGWQKRNEDYLAEIARDDALGDREYVEALEDLIDRAETMRDAKNEEMEREP